MTRVTDLWISMRRLRGGDCAVWIFDGIEGPNAYAMMKCTRCGYQTFFRMNPFPCPMCKEKERKMDSFEFTLHSPITDEEWDMITDVNFDHTDSITFQTKNGKKVRFVKEGPEIIRCRDCKHWETTWTNDFAPNYHYCPLVDGTRRDDFYCADAERRCESDG